MNKTKIYKIKDALKLNTYSKYHTQIINILKSDVNFTYTKNSNGIFFDINKLDENTLDKLFSLLNLHNSYDDKHILQYNNNYFIDEIDKTISNKMKKQLNKLNIK